jgi:hypothetical protein
LLDGDPWPGSNALVLPVRRGGEQFALRLTAPDESFPAEVAALRFWAGRGVALPRNGAYVKFHISAIMWMAGLCGRQRDLRW